MEDPLVGDAGKKKSILTLECLIFKVCQMINTMANVLGVI